jgi:23S rRNA (pseudouridine1915-N3)-methyltransferase
MKATLILVGKTVDKRFAELISEYTNRLKHYISFEINTIPELKNTKNLTSEQQKNSEAELIIKNLQPSDYVVLLDEHGKEMRSVEMADWMKRKMNTINKRIVFIIGGPYGFSQKIYDIAHEKLSMSKMTFSHQMIRLIFVEQLYRSMTILNGEPYHHE